MLNSKKNKGFSLVEVVVALSILVLVLSGTVTLIMSVLNLNLSSRDRTEAVSLAQEGLSKAVEALKSGSCSSGSITGSPLTSALDSNTYYEPEITCEVGGIKDTGGGKIDFDKTLTGYVKVVSIVKWNDRKTNPVNPSRADYNVYKVTQIVRD